MNGVVYSPTTGEILRNVYSDDEAQLLDMANEGEAVLIHDSMVDDTAFYVAGGVLAPRPTFDIPAEISVLVGEVRVFDLPPGTVVTFDGEAFALDDGRLEIEADIIAAYVIGLELWPYVSAEVRIVTGVN